MSTSFRLSEAKKNVRECISFAHESQVHDLLKCKGAESVAILESAEQGFVAAAGPYGTATVFMHNFPFF